MKKSTTTDRPTVVRRNGSPPKPKVVSMRGKFPYYIEYHPNPDSISIHTSCQMPEFRDAVSLGLRYSVRSKNPRRPVPEFFRRLARIRGLKSAYCFEGYELHCEKFNSLFSWEKILPSVLRTLQRRVAGKRPLLEAKSPVLPTPTGDDDPTDMFGV